MNQTLAAIDREGALQVLYASTVYHYSPVAQSVEQVTVNHWVGGSSPSRGAKIDDLWAFFMPVSKLFCEKFPALLILCHYGDTFIITSMLRMLPDIIYASP